jgi:hypothetical protein
MTTPKTNRVLDAHTAIVDGRNTGLAGCHDLRCFGRARCLRADPMLTGDIGLIASTRCITGERSHFIPVVLSA